MGANQPKRMKYSIPLNKKLNEIILNVINPKGSLNNEEKIKELMHKNISQGIIPSNFSQIFNKRERGIYNITSLMNLIYTKNANTYFKLSSDNTIYESIFNYDIIENNFNEEGNVKFNKKKKHFFEECLILKNYERDSFKVPNELLDIFQENKENCNSNLFSNKVKNEINNMKKKKKNLNNVGNNTNNKVIKKKKHNKNPKNPPVVIINMNVKDLYKLDSLERSLNGINKRKNNKNTNNNTKKELEKLITLNGTINPSKVNDDSFLKILNILQSPNK
jgi:hypothetical protein